MAIFCHKIVNSRCLPLLNTDSLFARVVDLDRSRIVGDKSQVTVASPAPEVVQNQKLRERLLSPVDDQQVISRCHDLVSAEDWQL